MSKETKILVVFFVSLALCVAVHADELLVPSEYPTIQGAIDAAYDGDVVIVANGTYTGPGNHDIDFLGKAITIRSENGPENCVIDCNGTEADPHRGFYFHSGEDENSILDGFTVINGYHEKGGAISINSNPTITNCILRSNTAAADWSRGAGGGIYCLQSQPTITNCTLNGNAANKEGGGIYCMKSDPTIANCTITNNFTKREDGGGWGGAIGFEESDPNIARCIISGNLSDWGGGIIFGEYSSPIITNCTMNNNSAQRYGGAIYCSCDEQTSSWIINCTITNNIAQSGAGIYCFGEDGTFVIANSTVNGNSSRYEGGGIYCGYNSTPTIINCTITGNTSEKGGGLVCGGSNPIITNCNITGNTAVEYAGGISCYGGNISITNGILWGNEAPKGPQIYLAGDSNALVNYTDVQGDQDDVYVGSDCTLNWGPGNIDLDPCFAFSTDYHIMPDSPCIDAGDPNYIVEPNETDLDGKPRIIGGRIDMGAYEYDSNSPAIAVSAPSFYFIQDWPETAPQTLLIRNCGGQPLHWEIVEDCNWLEITPINGVSTGQINEVIITVDPNALEPALYTCTFKVQGPNASNSPVTVQVEFRVRTILRVPSQDYSTIQAAINAAIDYDMVLVADGTYTGEGNRDIDFLGKPITVRSESGPENCIIDCNGTETDPHRGFYFQNGEGKNSILDGFTITGGYANNGPWDRGGGIYCNGVSLTVSNCVIRDNWANYCGGGIYNYNCSPTVRNCFFIENEAPDGGGMYNEDCTAMVTNCVFSGNYSSHYGGGIHSYDSYSTVVNCTFSKNYAASFGGGMYRSSSNSTATNCIFWGNTRGEGLHDRLAQINGTPRGVEYCCIESWDLGGTGNIDADPCFVQPGYWDANDTPDDANDDFWVEGDYHLLPTSPCIDTGDPNYIPEPNETDLDGNPRVRGDAIDMGAYETIIHEARLLILPRVINRKSSKPRIMAWLHLPQGITKDQVDADTSLILYPGSMKAMRQFVIPNRRRNTQRVSIFAVFDKAELMDAIPANGKVELQVLGRLRQSGQYFSGSDTIRIIPRRASRVVKKLF